MRTCRLSSKTEKSAGLPCRDSRGRATRRGSTRGTRRRVRCARPRCTRGTRVARRVRARARWPPGTRGPPRARTSRSGRWCRSRSPPDAARPDTRECASASPTPPFPPYSPLSVQYTHESRQTNPSPKHEYSNKLSMFSMSY